MAKLDEIEQDFRSALLSTPHAIDCAVSPLPCNCYRSVLSNAFFMAMQEARAARPAPVVSENVAHKHPVKPSKGERVGYLWEHSHSDGRTPHAHSLVLRNWKGAPPGVTISVNRDAFMHESSLGGVAPSEPWPRNPADRPL